MNFLLLAAEVHEEAFNLFDFKNNVINWVVLVALVVWLWNKFTPGAFQSRKEKIDALLAEAAANRKAGEDFLKEQRQRVANAEKEAQEILADASKLAGELKVQMQESTAKDMETLKHKIENQIESERRVAVNSLRQAAARASIELTREVLPTLMNEKTKAKLLTQFIEQLDETSAQGGLLESQN
ncbi:MAG TPA: hypothetical protein V6C72_01055 [Chroococcales cyanobacterium]